MWAGFAGAGGAIGPLFSAFGVFLYFQSVLGYSPLTAAVAQLPVAAALITVAPRSAGLAERFGPNRVVTAGWSGYRRDASSLTRREPSASTGSP